MGRLCERPGCSENASVAYGMRAEDLVFWLDVIRPSEVIAGGVLCQRHADSMIVPRNWTLDDLRDPELHLFRPPTIKRAPSSRARRPGHRDQETEQLQLGVLPPPETKSSEPEPIDDEALAVEESMLVAPTVHPALEPSDAEHARVEAAEAAPAIIDEIVPPVPAENPAVVAAADAGAIDVARSHESGARPEDDDTPASPWVPSFDSGDDLDGLLSARSPLLARAFRGDDRRS